MTRKNWWIFPSIFILTLIIFRQSLTYYFFQDDWFVLNWIRTGNLLSFFSFRTDIIYWRPLSMPIFFWIGKNLFGLNPIGFHLLAFSFHCLNIFLVYILMKQLKLKEFTSVFAAFIWGVSAFHFVPISWLSTSSYTLGPTFIFLAIIFFLKSKFKSSLLFFVFALCASELALTIPLLILVLDPKIKEKIKKIWPFFIFIIPYLTARFLIFPVPTRSDYAFTLNTKILVNTFWYFSWVFGMPERFSTIFYFSQIKSFLPLLKEFAKPLVGPIFLMISFILQLSIAKLDIKTVARGILWFIVGLSPVIFLSNHAYAMYLEIASLGIIYIFASCLERVKHIQLPVLFTVGLIWFVSSLVTVNFLRSNHWVPNEQAISKAYLNFVKEEIKDPPKGSIFVFRDASRDFLKKNNFDLVETENTLSQSLNGSDAIQVIFNDESLKSYYKKRQDSTTFPEGTNVITIDPKI